MANDDDPNAPYRVYEGDELKGTYAISQSIRWMLDSGRLDELPFPAPRKIAYFYAQIASIRDDTLRGSRQTYLGKLGRQ